MWLLLAPVFKTRGNFFFLLLTLPGGGKKEGLAPVLKTGARPSFLLKKKTGAKSFYSLE